MGSYPGPNPAFLLRILGYDRVGSRASERVRANGESGVRRVGKHQETQGGQSRGQPQPTQPKSAAQMVEYSPRRPKQNARGASRDASRRTASSGLPPAGVSHDAV
jgi:hypothetical protein